MTETYKLVRDFSAPKSLVWRAISEPELVSRWYGPGVETVLHVFDLRGGGEWLTEMKMQQGSSYQRADFTDVTVGEGYACIQAQTDSTWAIVDSQMMPGWPKRLALSISLAAIDTGTRLTLTWSPQDATDQEIATFNAMIDRMGGGWSMGMDELDRMLSELSG